VSFGVKAGLAENIFGVAVAPQQSSFFLSFPRLPFRPSSGRICDFNMAQAPATDLSWTFTEFVSYQRYVLALYVAVSR
jgi:hypothetical protein